MFDLFSKQNEKCNK